MSEGQVLCEKHGIPIERGSVCVQCVEENPPPTSDRDRRISGFIGGKIDLENPAKTATRGIMTTLFASTNPRAVMPLSGPAYSRAESAIYAALSTMMVPMEKMAEKNAALQKAVDGLQDAATENVILKGKLKEVALAAWIRAAESCESFESSTINEFHLWWEDEGKNL
jgi:hypothetical protein